MILIFISLVTNGIEHLFMCDYWLFTYTLLWSVWEQGVAGVFRGASIEAPMWYLHADVKWAVGDYRLDFRWTVQAGNVNSGVVSLTVLAVKLDEITKAEQVEEKSGLGLGALKQFEAIRW